MGDVSGRIVGASPGAYAYPLGHPGQKVDLAIDPATKTGTYSIRDVPTSASALVLFDGADRAELVPLALASGRETPVADRFGAAATLGDELLRMPLAGTVLAAVVPAGGATPWRPSFELPGTVHADVAPPSGGVLAIWPLPAGRFDVGATLPGFVGGRLTDTDPMVEVAAGATTPASVKLPVDLAAAAPGCGSVSASAPAPCENALVCEPSDGRCYECTVADASHCASGACNVATHLCKALKAVTSVFCTACTGDADCANPSMSMFCRIPSGAASGYCTTRGCTSDDQCPAGFDCGDAGICRPPEGCGAWIQTMGAPCYTNSRCDEGLEHGWCAGATTTAAGFCTAACRTNVDCTVGTAAFACVPGPGGTSPLRCVAQ